MVPLSQSDTLQEVLAAAQEKAGAAAQARASPLRDEPPSESAALAQELARDAYRSLQPEALPLVCSLLCDSQLPFPDASCTGALIVRPIACQLTKEV